MTAFRSESLVLGLIAAALAGALWLTRPSTSLGGEGPVPVLDTSWSPEAVDRIRFGAEDAPLVFEKSSGAWRLSSSYGYPVEEGRVQALIEAARALSLDRLATRDPGKHAAYALGEGAPRLQVFRGQTALRDLLIGRPGPSKAGVFVRRPGEDTVYLARPFRPALRATRSRDWLQGPLLPHLSTKALRKIVLLRGEEKLVLERKAREDLPPEQGWEIVEPLSHPAKPEAVRRLLGVIAGARLSEGLDPQLSPKVLGLDAPRLSLALTTVEDERLRLDFGRRLGAMVYVRSSERTGFFKASRSIFTALDLRAADLRETNVFAFKPAEVRSLSLAGLVDARLERDASGWRLERPERGAADGASAEAILAFLSGLVYLETIEEPDLGALGLARPRLSLRVETRDGASPGLRVGAEAEGKLYVQRRADGAVFAVDPKAFRELPLDLAALRGGLFGFLPGQVRRMVLERRGERPILIQRGPGKRWFGGFDAARMALLQRDKVLALAQALARFKASELAPIQEAKANSLAPYAGRLVVYLEGASPPTQLLAWGLVGEDAAVATHRGRPIYRVDPSALAPFKLDLLRDLRDRRPLPFPGLGLAKLREIAIKKRSGEEVVLRRADSAQWRLSAPDAPALQAEVAAYLRELVSIEASSLVADLARVREVTEDYEVELRLLLGNLTSISVLFSAPDAEGRRLAVVPVRGAADVAYLLSPDDSEGPIARRERFEGRALLGREVLLAEALTVRARGEAAQVFEKRAGRWYRASDGALGDTGALGSLLVNLEKLRVSSRAEGEELGFSPPLWRIEARIPAGRIGLEIGAPIGGKLWYVRRSDAPDRVWRAQANLVIQCLSPVEKLLDRKLFTLLEPEIRSVAWITPAGRIRIAREAPGKTWRIEEPAGLSADADRAQIAVDRLLALQASSAVIPSRSWTGAVKTISLAAESGEQRLEFAEAGAEALLVRRPDGELRAVSAKDAAAAFPELSEIEQRSVLALPPSALRGLRLDFAAGSEELALLEGAWVFRDDGGATDEFQLKLLTIALSKLRKEGSVSGSAAELGLDPPRLTITARTASAERKLELGALRGGEVVCRLDGGEIFLGSAQGLAQIAAWTSRRWIEPLAITQGQPSSLKSLAFRVGERDLSLERRGEDWVLEPGGAVISDEGLSRQLFALTFLRGKRPTASSEPKKEGLDPPWFRLRYETRGGQAFTVDFAAARDGEMAVRRGERMVMAAAAKPLKAIARLKSLADEAGPK